MKKLLRDIFFLNSGFSFRTKIENDPEGDVLIIQMRDLENNYSTISNDLTRINDIGFLEKFFLQKGDILFIAKGQNNFALSYNPDIKRSEKVIASSVFFVLQPKIEGINPEYVAWYINQPQAQEYLHAGKEGTMVTNINRQTLENLEIILPPLKEQSEIAYINKLLEKEYILTQKLLETRRKLADKHFKNKLHAYDKN